MVLTRPISTPLKVTFEFGSITRPARLETTVNCSVGVSFPRNCRKTNVVMSANMASRTTPASFSGGRRWVFRGAVIGRYTVRLKFGLVP